MLRKALNSERTKLPPNLFPHISRHFSHSTAKHSHTLLRSRLPENPGVPLPFFFWAPSLHPPPQSDSWVYLNQPVPAHHPQGMQAQHGRAAAPAPTPCIPAIPRKPATHGP